MRQLLDYILEKYNNANKGDEFYTRLVDIEKGLKQFDFKSKVVYCNCDDPSFSNFWKYFYENFKSLKLKKLLATYYSKDPKLYEYEGGEVKVSDIDSGDFRDNGEIMKQCDIVVTNPPFSGKLPDELVKMCLKYKKEFIFLCKNDWYTRKGAFDFYKSGQLNINNIEVGKFDGPNSSTKVTCYWFTSLELNKDKFKATKKYVPEAYPKYKNYDAIEVGAYANIPEDYDGNMGVSLSFGKYLNRDQYEVVDVLDKPIGEDGKKYFKRLIIKKRTS